MALASGSRILEAKAVIVLRHKSTVRVWLEELRQIYDCPAFASEDDRREEREAYHNLILQLEEYGGILKQGLGMMTRVRSKVAHLQRMGVRYRDDMPREFYHFKRLPALASMNEYMREMEDSYNALHPHICDACNKKT